MKKLFAIILALAMTFALSAAALATSDDPVTTGTITIQNPNAGETYNAYKIFDLTYVGASYAYTIKTDNPWYGTVKTYAETEANGLTLTQSAGDTSTYVVTVDDTKFDAATFAAALKVALGNMTTAPTAAATATATDRPTGPLALSPKVAFGYYFVTSTLGSVCSLDSNDPDVTIFEKNTAENPPGFEETNGKTFVSDPDTNTASDDSAQIGDTVHFKIEAHVPPILNTYEVKHYEFTDTMSKGMSYVADSIKVTLYPGYTPRTEGANPTPGSFVGTPKVLTLGDDASTAQYTFATSEDESGNPVLTITVYPQHIEGYYPDAYILIEYNVKMNKDSEFENKNTVTLDWECEETPEVSDPPTTEEPGVPPQTDTEVKVYGFVFDKRDSQNNHLPADPATAADPNDYAQFVLKVRTPKKDAQGNYTYEYKEVKVVEVTESYAQPLPTVTDNPIPEGTNVQHYYRVADEDDTQYATITGGVFSIFGLKELEEIADLPQGVEQPCYVLQETKAPDGYNMYTDDIVLHIKEAGDAKPAATGEGGTAGDGWMDSLVSIENSAGSQLPSTGGIGTTIFYIVGGLLMVGAVVLLVVRKKMSVTE